VNSSRRTLLFLLAAFLIPAVFAIWTETHETIPPGNITGARMFILKRRILQFAHDHDTLPPDLTVLPPLQSKFDSLITDEWGRPIVYSATPAAVVTLQSPGIPGSNKTITAIFSARDSGGEWQDLTTPWIKDPLQP